MFRRFVGVYYDYFTAIERQETEHYMPNYKTHDTIGVITAITSGIATIATDILSFGDSLLLGFAIVLGTYFLSPDLDTDSKIYARWGILRWYWYPYKEIIKHRSILSHSGPLSATIRLLYMLCIPLVILTFTLPYTVDRGDIVYMITPALSSIALIWAGVMIADTIHVIADLLSTEIKRIL